MDTYRKIPASELSSLKRYFAAPEFRACDYTVGCFYLWSDYFHYRCRVESGYLIVRGEAEGKPFYLFPAGEGDLTPVLDAIKAETLELGLPLIFAGVPESRFDALFSSAPFHSVLSERDWYDYVYRAEDLKNLSGKKFHGQKNHVNFFQKTYNPQYLPLDRGNVCRVARFLKHLEAAENDREDELRYEKSHILELMEHWDDAGQEGGILVSDQKIVAFTVGEVKGDTLYVHVEKADRAYRGAYTAMMRAFVAAILTKFPSVRFVNREDDMGIEGLRKAKTDLHPTELIEKHNVVLSYSAEVLPQWTKLSEACEI